MDDLRTRIIAALARADQDWCSDRPLYEDMADAVIRELGAIPDREFTDQWGHHWEWCGGQPGTWAWRITRLPDQCANCLRRGDERDGCNCAYPEGHPSNDR